MEYNQEIPNAVEAEEALIGSILIAPEVLRAVENIITPEQFFIHRYGWAYSAMLRLHKDKKAIDFLTLKSELSDLGKLEEFGGVAEITRLMGSAPNSYNAETYAKEINEYWIRRQMLEVASKVSKMAFGTQWGIDQIQQKTTKLVQECFSGVSTDSSIIYASEAINHQFDVMNSEVQNGVDFIPTGFIDIDSLLNGGPRPGDLVIVAGRPGMGKTALLLDYMKNNCDRKDRDGSDKYDVFFSLEMGSDQLIERVVSKFGVSFTNIRSRKLDDTEYSIYMSAVETVNKYKFIVIDISSLNPTQLVSILLKILLKHEVENIYIDYLQLMTVEGKRSGNRVEEVSEISRQLKIIAREYHMVVYAGAQLSREVEKRANKRPVLSDLRESGSIEQDGDIIQFVYRPEVYSDDPIHLNIAEIITAKHRNGAVGSCTLLFRKNFVRFENAVVRTVDLGNLPGTKKKEPYKDFTV